MRTFLRVGNPITFIVVRVYTFISVLMGSMLRIYQCKYLKSSQILHSGPSRTCFQTIKSSLGTCFISKYYQFLDFKLFLQFVTRFIAMHSNESRGLQWCFLFSLLPYNGFEVGLKRITL